MRLKKIIKILFFLVYSQLIFGQGNQEAIKTDNYTYLLKTPKEWVMDRDISGIQAGYYPKRSSWEEAPSIMYVNIVDADNENAANIFGLIDYDLENYYISSPGLKLEYGEKLNFDNGDYISMVLYLYGSEEGSLNTHNMAVAYIPQFKEIMNVVLSSQNREDFEKTIPVFKELVQSYDVTTDRLAADLK